MDNNYVYDEGALMLSAALIQNSSLKELSLCNCGIKREGGIALAKMLACNSTLISLGIYYYWL